MIDVVYPSGSHGSFLALLLNSMSGIYGKNFQHLAIYDNVEYCAAPIFRAVHHNTSTPAVKIKVYQPSYLKYFAMCLNRTSGLNFLIDDIGFNMFEKIKQHSILKFFAKSLTEISGQTEGNVESKYVREWFRACFFADYGMTIQQFTLSKENKGDYTIDFESFYNGSILEHCYQIYQKFNLSIIDLKVAEDLVKQFPKKLIYFSIDLDINQILTAIDKNISFDLSNTNLLQQAWIDNYLVIRYNIDPLLSNEYFLDTQELRKAYNLL